MVSRVFIFILLNCICYDTTGQGFLVSPLYDNRGTPIHQFNFLVMLTGEKERKQIGLDSLLCGTESDSWKVRFGSPFLSKQRNEER
jgi:hypothetical protein